MDNYNSNKLKNINSLSVSQPTSAFQLNTLGNSSNNVFTNNINNNSNNNNNNYLSRQHTLNYFLNKKKKSFFERHQKLFSKFLPPRLKPVIYRRCCVLLIECFLYFLGYMLLVIFFREFFPIFICGMVAMVAIYIMGTLTIKYKLVSLIYVIVQSILNFALLLYFVDYYSSFKSSDPSVLSNAESLNFTKHNFLFLINIILCLISITIFFPKYLFSISLLVILNIINIIIHIVILSIFNLPNYFIFQNLVITITISILLFIYQLVIYKNEKDIEAKEKRFRNIFDTSSEALVIHRNGIIIDVNSTFEKMFEVEADDLLNPVPCAIWELLPELESIFQNKLKESLRNLNSIHQNNSNQNNSNQNNSNVLNINNLNFLNNLNNPNYSNTNGGNNSTLNSNNNSINNSRSNSFIMNGNNIIGGGLDTTTNGGGINASGNRMITRTSRSNTGLSDNSSIFDDSDSVDFFSLKNINKQPIVFDTIGIKPCGSEFTVQVKIENKYDKVSSSDFDVISIIDTTARKKLIIADQQLRRAEEINDAKIRFLTTVSHEVRTPISGILSSVGILDESLVDSNQREYLGFIKDSADYLLDLITDILDFSKIEAGKMELERVEFNLLKMLEDSINIVYRNAHDRGINVVTFVEQDVPIFLIGDSHRIKQVLLNYLSNAIKFTSKGQVTVRVSIDEKSSEGVKIMFSVEDSGVGIKDEFQEQLFQPFHQVGSLRQYLGTGLGLSISKRLTAMMGGEVGFKSTFGVGSTFHFTALFQINPNSLLPLGKMGSILSTTLLNKMDNINLFKKVNGFIYDDNIHVSKSISTFLNYLSIQLKIITPSNDNNLKLEITNYLNNLQSNQLNKLVIKQQQQQQQELLSDDDGDDEKFNQQVNDYNQDENDQDEEEYTIIITNSLSNENLNHFKEKIKSIPNPTNIYWFCLNDNSLQVIDPFYTGIVKKPCNFPNIVETIFKVFNQVLQIDHYYVLTNRSKDDYRLYCKQRKELDLKNNSNNNNNIKLLNVSNNSEQSTQLLNNSNNNNRKNNKIQNSKINPITRTKQVFVRKNSNSYSDHVPITRGLIQDVSPRLSSSPVSLAIPQININNKNRNKDLSPSGSSSNTPISTSAVATPTFQSSCSNSVLVSNININGSGFFNGGECTVNINSNLSPTIQNINNGCFSPTSGTASPTIICTTPELNSQLINSINNNNTGSNNQIDLNNSINNNNTCNNNNKQLSTESINKKDQILLSSSSTTTVNTTLNSKSTTPFIVPPLDIQSNSVLSSLRFVDNSDGSSNNSPNFIPMDRTQYKILLVDDNMVNIKIFSKYIKDGGYQHDIAMDGNQAIEATKKNYYPIIFMDCHMDPMDGYQATEIIRRFEKSLIQNHGKSNYKKSTIIALTALDLGGMSSGKDKCFEIGMDDFLQKPIKPKTIIDTIEKHIRKFNINDIEYGLQSIKDWKLDVDV